MLKHGSLFSGIGGFDLAAEWKGWQNVFHCEIDLFCKHILNYYWPEAITYHDITKTDFTIHRGTIDVLTGGFPCQPYSLAGQRKGTEDSRHLWPEMLRAIREIQPAWVVGENVYGLINWGRGMVFNQVQADLEAEGYQIQPVILPACALDAPHRRDRIWFIAYNASYAGCLAGNGRQSIQCDCIEHRENSEGHKAANQPNRSFEAGIDTNTDSQYSALSKQQRDKRSTDFNTGRDSESRDVTYPNEKLYKLSKSQKWATETGAWQQSAGGIIINNSNPGSKRLQVPKQEKLPGENRHYKGRTIEQFYTAPSWDNWPTQSPVCNGDDGISARLDFAAVFGGIKFPRQPARAFNRWRNESLKSGGNAAVPQIPYKIFDAIEQYILSITQ